MPFEGIPSDDVLKPKVSPEAEKQVTKEEEKPKLRGFHALRAGLDPRTGEPKKPGWSAVPTQQEEYKDPYAKAREYLRTLPEGSSEQAEAVRYLNVLDSGGRFDTPELQVLAQNVESRLAQMAPQTSNLSRVEMINGRSPASQLLDVLIDRAERDKVKQYLAIAQSGHLFDTEERQAIKRDVEGLVEKYIFKSN